MTAVIQARTSLLALDAEVTHFTSLEVVLRHNKPASWVLSGVDPSSDAATTLAQPGAGIIVRRGEDVLVSGPVTRPERRWNTQEDAYDFAGVSDDIWLERRLVNPVPLGPPYTASAYDVRSGVAETVLRSYVGAHAGPGARDERRVFGLSLAADAGRGTTVVGRGRFQVLGDLMRQLAIAGGDLGFRIVQSGSGLQFQVYQPTDLSDSVVFSPGLGNLASYGYVSEAPGANHVIAAGSGEGTARTFVEGGDSGSIAKWGRVESFRDRRDTADLTELAQSRDEELAEKAETSGLSLSPLDTESIAFSRDYGLGDKVSVMVDGVRISDVLREVRVTYDENGETVTPVLETPGNQTGPRVFDEVRALRRRVRDLERR